MEIRCLYDKLVKVSDLKNHPKNRNTHPEEQIRRLADILKYQGWRYPIKISKQSGFITAGHGRLLAARINDWEEVPVNFQDYENETQEYADVQSDNAIASWAELDLAQINIDLPDLGPDFDIDLLGIKDFELEPADKFHEDEDAIPEAPKEPISKLGDIYELGNHRVLCADSVIPEHLNLIMSGHRADMVFTSPPYNQNLDSFKPSGMQKENPDWIKKMGTAYFDSLPEEQYQQQQIKLLNLLHMHTSNNASCFYNHKPRYRNKEVLHPLQWIWKSEWKLRQEIIWDRGGSITLNARMFMPCDERIYWLTKGDFIFDDSTQIKTWSSVWRISPVNEIKGVSAPFPNEVPFRGISACSLPNMSVLEPYLGTGTTLIASEKLGRRCFGMDINPAYVDVAISRWCKFTGKNQIKRNGEEITWS